MKHINEYANARFDYFNSMCSRDVLEIVNESQLFIQRGKEIDSIIAKMHKYSYNMLNGHIVEGINDDIVFTVEEEFAARDILHVMCNKYLDALNEELQSVNEQLEAIDQQIINEGITDLIQKSKDTLTHIAKVVGSKIKEVKDFIVTVLKAAMKGIKDFCSNIAEMFIRFGCSLQQLIEKFKLNKIGNPEEEYGDMIKDYTTKDTVKQYAQSNFFESYGLELAMIHEDENVDNIYGQAMNAEPGKAERKFLKMVFQIFIGWAFTSLVPLLMMFIPGIGVAAGLVQQILRILWSSVSIYKLIKNFIDTVKSPAWKKKKKLSKIAYCIFMAGMLFLTVQTAGKSIGDFKQSLDLIEKYGTEALKAISPSDEVMQLAKMINKFLKSDTAAENIKNFESCSIEILKASEKIDIKENDAASGNESLQKALEKNVGKSAAKWEETAMANKDEILAGMPKSDTNIITNIKFPGGVNGFVAKYADKLKEAGLDEHALKVFKQVGAGTDKFSAVAGEGAQKQWAALYQNLSKEQFEIMKRVASENNINFSFTDLGASSGVVKTITKTLIKQVIPGLKNAVMFPGCGGIVDKYSGDFAMRLGSNRTKNLIYEIEDMREVPMSRLKEMCSDAAKHYNESIDDIDVNMINEDTEEGGTDTAMPAASNMYETMKKQLNENYKRLKEALENEEIKKDKKLYKELKKLQEQMGEDVEDYKCLVFYGRLSEKFNKKKKAKDDETKNESLEDETILEGLDIDELIEEGWLKDKFNSAKDKFKEWNKSDAEKEEDEKKENGEESNDEGSEKKDDEGKSAAKLVPVFFINPMLMCCGDLAQSADRKGKRAWRKKVYYLKGLFARLEFFPVNGGLSMSDLGKMLNEIVLASIKACWNMCGLNKPCVKKSDDKDAKFEVVDDKDSKNEKSTKRKDFGNFTNDEITTILNEPKKIADYYDGKFADAIGAQKIIGKEGEEHKNGKESEKEHTERVHKAIENYLMNNDEIKNFAKEHKKLAKAIYKRDDNDELTLKPEAVDELTYLMDRTNKIAFQEKDKENVFKKIGKLFKKEEGDMKLIDKLDRDELEKFVYLLHKIYDADKQKKTYKEALAFIDNMNMILNEYLEWQEQNEIL